MRPERFDSANSLSAMIIRIVAASLLALMVFQAGATRAADSALQSSAGPVYDSQSFIKELGRLKKGLESARKSTEALRSYRESLPESWAVESGRRHYDVPTDLLVSRLEAVSKPGTGL